MTTFEVTVDLTVVMEVEAENAELASCRAGAEIGGALGIVNGEILERGRTSTLVMR